jgi:TIR domain
MDQIPALLDLARRGQHTQQFVCLRGEVRSSIIFQRVATTIRIPGNTAHAFRAIKLRRDGWVCMAKLWLTYAWKDNQDQDVDHVIEELKKVGLEVVFDRVHLIPGQKIWPQIDQAISDPSISGWAIFATANSFSSEACLEELAYALDRALRTRGGDFPQL